jgi:hypothetical protein
MKGRGIEDRPQFLKSSPPPSPVEGEGVFMIFWESIKFINPVFRRF